MLQVGFGLELLGLIFSLLGLPLSIRLRLLETALAIANRIAQNAPLSVRAVKRLVRDGRITTVGGDRRASVKSADLALQLLADLAPHLLEPVCARMEMEPGRRRVVAPASAGSDGRADP